MPRTHLFLALGHYPFGEVLLAIRLARELAARGDRVLFLATSGQALLLKGQPFRYGIIDRTWGRIDEATRDVIASEKCDDLVLVDAAAVFLGLLITGLNQGFLPRLTVPVVALDVWDLRLTGRSWDTLSGTWDLPAEVEQLQRRMVPVPFGRLDTLGGYNALPPAPSVGDDDARARTRAELGLANGQRLLLMTTAAWQTAKAQANERQR